MNFAEAWATVKGSSTLSPVNLSSFLFGLEDWNFEAVVAEVYSFSIV